MQAICECNSTECFLTFNIPLRELQAIQAAGNIIIAVGCPTGPDLLDIFVRRESGYTVYKDGQLIDKKEANEA